MIVDSSGANRSPRVDGRNDSVHITPSRTYARGCFAFCSSSPRISSKRAFDTEASRSARPCAAPERSATVLSSYTFSISQLSVSCISSSPTSWPSMPMLCAATARTSGSGSTRHFFSGGSSLGR